LGCICLRVQSPLRMHRCVYHAHAGVCACMRGDFLWLRPVRPHVCPSLRGGRGPHARAVRGRSISSTKVEALPESLGQCKLLEELCVPGRIPRRWRRRRRRRCRSSAAAEPRARMAGARCRPARAFGEGRSRPARPHGWRAGTRRTPSSRRCRRRPTGRTSRDCECPRRRAHTAPPMRRRQVGRVVSARARLARLGTMCAHMCVRSSSCMRVRTYARMRRMHPSVRVGACVCARTHTAAARAAGGVRGRPSSRHHSAHVYHSMCACAHVHMYACARRMHLGVRWRGHGRVRVRGGSGRPLIVCHFVHFL
jgi:hypothetical protein